MTRSPLRTVAVLAACALAVHELRYALAPDPHGAGAGHAYLAAVAPAVAALFAAACAAFGFALTRGGRAAKTPPSSFGRLWAWASVALGATYAVQEVLEGVLSAGNAGGAVAVVANGGWIGFVLALALAVVVALLLRGAEVVLTSARRRAPGRWAPPPRPLRPPMAAAARRDVVARHLAGRGPPLVSATR